MTATASKYGLFSPILTTMPGASGDWEEGATIDDLAAIAQAAERLGYDHLTCSEHVGLPFSQEAMRGARYYDPLATFGYLAAVTERIRLATYILVLGYSHPLEIAKRYGTLDVFARGRLVLGMGVGSLKEEFDLLGLGGVEFEERGVRADDALRALKASWGRRVPEYHGPYYDFEGMVVDPCATRTDVPIWIGGRSVRSLRRAVELGDGWIPFGAIEQLGAMIEKAKEQPSWHARSKPLDILLRPELPLDPIGAPGRVADDIRRIFAVGATGLTVTLTSRSRAHYIEQLEALAALAI